MAPLQLNGGLLGIKRHRIDAIDIDEQGGICDAEDRTVSSELLDELHDARCLRSIVVPQDDARWS